MNIAAEKDALLERYIEAETRRVKRFRRRRKIGTPRFDGWIIRLFQLHEKYSDRFTLDEYDFIMRGYENDEVFAHNIQVKYKLRPLNVMREMLRAELYYPEIRTGDKKYQILDLSSGGCGVHQVGTYYGHSVISTEYSEAIPHNQPIYDDLGIDIVPFDGQEDVFPFEDNSADILTCYQALNLYSRPRKYPQKVREMERISRDKICIIYNDLHKDTVEGDDLAKMTKQSMRGCKLIKERYKIAGEYGDPDANLLAHVILVDDQIISKAKAARAEREEAEQGAGIKKPAI